MTVHHGAPRHRVATADPPKPTVAALPSAPTDRGTGGDAPQGPPTPNAKQGALRRVGGMLWSRKWLVMTITVVVGISGWQGTKAFLGPATQVDRVQRGALIESVVATGSVENPYRVIIGSQITGIVETVPVEEGQRVTKGQALIRLESRELRADVVQAQGALAQAHAHIRQLTELTLPTGRSALGEAQATRLNAQQVFTRAAQLARDGYQTRATVEGAQKDLDVANSQVRSAEAQVYTASPGGSDYVTGQALLAQAQASLETATSRLAYATISAPRDGVLITRNVEQGTVAQPGNTLLVLAPDGVTQLLLQIDERNLGKLALGQAAIASADAYATEKFAAVITYINPAVDITRASVEVKLTVTDPPAYLRQDMTVSVDVEVAHSQDTLLLPGRSVREALSAQPWVMAIRNGRARRQPVHLGLQGTTRIEILDGVAMGDLVIPATSPILAGQRVRPITP